MLVASMPRSAGELQQVLTAPLILNLETPSDPLAPRTVDIPQGVYRPEMLQELGKVGSPVRELAPERVTAIKGTSAVALLEGDSGIIETAERPHRCRQGNTDVLCGS